MNEKDKETRKKLREINTIKDFENLINEIMLSEEERKILWLHYKEKKTFIDIGEEIGLAESTVKKRHKQLLRKIGNLF